MPKTDDWSTGNSRDRSEEVNKSMRVPGIPRMEPLMPSKKKESDVKKESDLGDGFKLRIH